tara:strand:- start:56 stop:580 length:525 start_codon:yes stop_codon:yes gene_type:complete
MIIDSDKYWKTILREARAEDTETIMISTYGMYAGISETGENTAAKYNFDRDQQHILDLSNAGKKVIFLLSESDPIICTPDCEHCIAKAKKRDARNNAHFDAWPNVSWFLTQSHHLKAFLVKKKDGRVLGYTGGRNFSSSSWRDVSVELSEDDATALMKYLIFAIKAYSVKLSDI